MPIYDLFDQLERKNGAQDATISHLNLLRATKSQQTDAGKGAIEPPDVKNRLFAAIAARLFFFVLLLIDLLWGVWSGVLFVAGLVANLCIGFKWSWLRRFFSRRFLNLKRAAICSIALLVAVFSPALGTMIACSYFLMYDKKGVEEIVPSVLQDQFREFFP
ncbi:MAG: hypothetical protein AAF443_05560 [Chlamydiota bacterium]